MTLWLSTAYVARGAVCSCSRKAGRLAAGSSNQLTRCKPCAPFVLYLTDHVVGLARVNEISPLSTRSGHAEIHPHRSQSGVVSPVARRTARVASVLEVGARVPIPFLSSILGAAAAVAKHVNAHLANRQSCRQLAQQCQQVHGLLERVSSVPAANEQQVFDIMGRLKELLEDVESRLLKFSSLPPGAVLLAAEECDRGFQSDSQAIQFQLTLLLGHLTVVCNRTSSDVDA